jgi:N-acetylmuramoyl-L-alanine amidase
MKTVDELLEEMKKNKLEIKNDFLSMNPYSRRGEIRKETLGIVIHWPQSAGSTAKVVRDYFESLKDQPALIDGPDDTQIPNPKLTWGSTQYTVGLEGEIIRMMGDDEVAFQVGADEPDPKSGKIYTDFTRKHFINYSTNPNNPNYCCVGIEVCHPDWTGEFTESSLLSAAKLSAMLIRKYKLGIENVCRHWDIVGNKECPLYYVVNEISWTSFLNTVRLFL